MLVIIRTIYSNDLFVYYFFKSPDLFFLYLRVFVSNQTHILQKLAEVFFMNSSSAKCCIALGKVACTKD